jgi:hypothetical protein
MNTTAPQTYTITNDSLANGESQHPLHFKISANNIYYELGFTKYFSRSVGELLYYA